MLRRLLNKPPDGGGAAGSVETFDAPAPLRAATAGFFAAVFAAALAVFVAATFALALPLLLPAALRTAAARFAAVNAFAFALLFPFPALLPERFFDADADFDVLDFAMGQSPNLNVLEAEPVRPPDQNANQNGIAGPGIAIMRRFVMLLRGP
ncbi:MAG: hypothetical protein AB7T86_14105 [Xanthobacteraceae bacterium]|uniref:hypothetical protein n=1 Tax=Pseudolabrys sp. TaxID=1960880 RepID=UPI003D1252FF